MKYSGIGGQAVIEGIMMKNGQNYATAVRKSDGSIALQKETYVSMTEKYPLCALPFVRGVFSFADSMILGMRTLTWSASFFEEEEEEEEPGRLEKWLEKTFGDSLEKFLMGAVTVFSFVMAILIFMVLPLGISWLLKKVIGSELLLAFLEGCVRLSIFILYIKLISNMEDIRRTYQYHGAEHKCINCLEHGLTLNVEHVRQSSKQHKRCGTSFLILVMMISILFFMVIRVHGFLPKVLSRILLIPVIAGVSYEFLRIAGRSDAGIVNLLSKPGLWMQNLTTSEPDDSMIEVAIAAVEAVFDWKAYLTENFPEQYPQGYFAEPEGADLSAAPEQPQALTENSPAERKETGAQP